MNSLPSGTVMLWLGTAASIPAGWQAYTAANGKFIRGVPAGGTVGTTGGAETHVHTAGTISDGGAHGHPEITITHGSTGPSTNHAVTGTGYGIYGAAPHRHDGTLTLESVADHGHTNSSTNTGSANNLPPYKKGIYIVKI
jgi:hypothetical protein